MLHETIRNDNFSTTQGCNIVATLFRITFIAPTLQRCVALKIVCYTGDLSGRITLYSALCAQEKRAFMPRRLSPPHRLPLGIPVKIAIDRKNGKRAWNDGKRELLSFLFPSCPARSLFLSPSHNPQPPQPSP